MLINGLNDEIVPPDHTLRLREAATHAPSVVVHSVPDGTHNDTWLKAGPVYVRWLLDFLAAHSAQ